MSDIDADGLPAWTAFGACAGEDPELFFADDDEAADEARAICATCPVRRPCLEHAISRGERYGIWGGMDLRERRRHARGGAAGRRAGAQPTHLRLVR